MPRYLIERTVPGASTLTPDALRKIAHTSCSTLQSMDNASAYHWLHSYVAGDKIYCVHIAPDAETVREHSERAGFPIDRITEITATFDPTAADQPVTASA